MSSAGYRGSCGGGSGGGGGDVVGSFSCRLC